MHTSNSGSGRSSGTGNTKTSAWNQLVQKTSQVKRSKVHCCLYHAVGGKETKGACVLALRHDSGQHQNHSTKHHKLRTRATAIKTDKTNQALGTPVQQPIRVLHTVRLAVSWAISRSTFNPEKGVGYAGLRACPAFARDVTSWLGPKNARHARHSTNVHRRTYLRGRKPAHQTDQSALTGLTV